MTPAQVLAFVYSQPAVRRWRMAMLTRATGSTPRVEGALIAFSNEGETLGSVGGGQAEAEVLFALAAHDVESELPARLLQLDLRGGSGAQGICGGQMQVQLRQVNFQQIQQAADGLQAGHAVSAAVLGFDAPELFIKPAPQLLIVGAGHCGAALAHLCSTLGYQLFCLDSRAPQHADMLPLQCVYSNVVDSLLLQLRRTRPDVVLLTRNAQEDCAALRALHQWAGGTPMWHEAFAYLGMMGSSRRIRAVAAALPFSIAHISAPVGLKIGAQTPAEIAVSIAAALIQARSVMQST